MIKKILNSSLFKSSGIYTIASLINSALPLLLLPYLVKILSVESYGAVAIFMLVQAFLGPFVSMNVHAAISRKFFDEDSEKNFPIYLFNALLIILICTIVTFLSVEIFAEFLTNFTNINRVWLLAAVLGASGQFITTSILTVLQVKSKPVLYGIVQIALTITNLSLTFILINKYNYGASGRVFAIVYSYLACTIVLLIWFLSTKQILIEFKKEYYKHALFYGAPLIPHVLGGIILGMADRLMINKLDSTYEAGIFSVALQLCSIITVILSSFNAAFIPWLFKKLKENEEIEKRKIVKYTYFGFVAITITAFAYYLILPNVIHFVAGNKYNNSIKFINWILIGIVFNGFYLLVSNYIFFAQKTYLLAISTFCCALIYWPVAMIMFKYFGSEGIPIASAICFFLLFSATWLLSAKVYKMPWLSA